VGNPDSADEVGAMTAALPSNYGRKVGTVARADEVADVHQDRQAVWLAGQLDEMEAGLVTQLTSLTGELAAVRKLLTGILVSICVGLVSIPVGIIWTAAIARGG